MRTNVAANEVLSNHDLAEILDEIAQRLGRQAANPFRIAAYRAAAVTVRGWNEPLANLCRREGIAGLRRLPGVGKSIARKLAELIRRGRLRSLESLRRKQAADDTLTSLPMIGPLLADRIRTKLGIESLEEMYAAVYDGRLRRIAGVGRKRVQAIRESLAVRLNRDAPARPEVDDCNPPPIALLLEIDRLYREQAKAGRMLTVAPRRFNPTGAAWLPVLRLTRHGHRYGAMFSNSTRSHELDHDHDWVVIYRDTKEEFGIWTVITSQYGILSGKRIVRGRETECRAYYEEARRVQKCLPVQLAPDAGNIGAEYDWSV